MIPSHSDYNLLFKNDLDSSLVQMPQVQVVSPARVSMNPQLTQHVVSLVCC